MIDLRNQAAIVGYGHVPFGKRRERAEKGHLRLVIEAVAAACADAGITPQDVGGFGQMGPTSPVTGGDATKEPARVRPG